MQNNAKEPQHLKTYPRRKELIAYKDSLTDKEGQDIYDFCNLAKILCDMTKKEDLIVENGRTFIKNKLPKSFNGTVVNPIVVDMILYSCNQSGFICSYEVLEDLILVTYDITDFLELIQD